MSKTAKWIIGIIVIITIIAGVWYLQKSNNNPAQISPVASSTESVRVGVSVALTGPSAFIGDSYLDGINMAQKEINDTGGVNGKKIDLIIEDNQNLAKEGLDSLNTMLLKNPDMIISTMSVPTVAMSPVVKATGKPLMVAAVFADIVSKNDNAISFFSRPVDDAEASVQAMTKNKVKKVGVLYLNSEYGKAGFDAFEKKAEVAGIKIIATEAFMGDVTDFATPLLKIKGEKPDALYIVAINSSPIIKSAKLNKVAIQIYTNLIPVFGSLVYKDPATFTDVYLTAPKVAIEGTPEYESFRAKAVASGINIEGNSLGYTSVGYDNLKSVAKVFESPEASRDFVKIFNGLGSWSGVNGTYDLSSRDVGIALYPVQFKDSKLIEVK